MSRVLLVHGIAQQYRGAQTLHAACAPALCDGVALAGGRLTTDDVAVAFYGDLFRPPGRTVGMPDYDAADLTDDYELELLALLWTQAGTDTQTRVRAPLWTQRALHAVNRMSFFAGLSERVMVGSLRQVRWYFTDPLVRRRIRERVVAAITPDTRVLVGHSLGSVVAYEVLRGDPGLPVTTLVTLGSPLGIPNLVYDRLEPGCDRTPVAEHWTNIADRGDMVAMVKELGPLFGDQVRDVLVHNGVKAHDVRPYLTARETGLAVRHGLGGEG